MKRALCIWLPQWPLQRLAAARDELSTRAVVLYELHSSGGAKVTGYCPRLDQAAATNWNLQTLRGIRPGMPLAEATALALRLNTDPQVGQEDREQPHLELSDAAADRAALEAVADDALRFAPTVGIEEATADSLLLDVTGLGALCGGEQTLARRVVADFRRRRLTVRVALADTPGAAWGVAHFAPLVFQNQASEVTSILQAIGEPLVVAEGETSTALASLPPAALRLPEETCFLLGELGIKRIEQLAALPREALLARFGPLVLLRLDQAWGRAAEAIAARAVPPEWTFEWLLEHPTGRREMIDWVVEQLVVRVCQTLARERRGVLRLACRFEPERGPHVEFVVGLYRPSANERHVGELVRLKLETARFPEPVAKICFQVLALDALEIQQQELFSGQQGRDSPRELAALVDRLGNRLGADAVVRPWLLAGAQPEFSCQYKPVASLKKRHARRRAKTTGPENSRLSVQLGDRPLMLEPSPEVLAVVSVIPDGPPVKFRYAGEDHRVQRYWGPERIETGWWRSQCIRRDYYQVETERGERYWLFRELNSGTWCLQGKF